MASPFLHARFEPRLYERVVASARAFLAKDPDPGGGTHSLVSRYVQALEAHAGRICEAERRGRARALAEIAEGALEPLDGQELTFPEFRPEAGPVCPESVDTPRRRGFLREALAASGPVRSSKRCRSRSRRSRPPVCSARRERGNCGPRRSPGRGGVAMAPARADRADRDAIEARLSSEAEAAAMPLLEPRRFHVVDTCPATKLNDLAAEHPELLDEIVRRRGGVFQQL